MGQKRSYAHIKAQKKIKKDEGYICTVCGSSENSQGHHLVSYSEGGDAHVQNMMTLCQSCHSKYHNGKLKIDIERF